MSYIILGTYRGDTEQLDETDTREDAEYLHREYQIAYGRDWEFTIDVACPSCNLAKINGVICHESGCPDSHLFTTRECKWCGSNFEPEYSEQRCCCDDCAQAYTT